jgi:hypothetical protein
MEKPRFDPKTLNDPADGDSPSGDALIAFAEGDHEPLARVLERVAGTLPRGTSICVRIAADIVRRARVTEDGKVKLANNAKRKPGRKKVTPAERIGRFLGDLGEPGGLKRMSDTKRATFRADQILVDLRLKYPKKRKIPGVNGELVWLRHEAARIAIERLEESDGRPPTTSVEQIIELLDRPRSRRQLFRPAKEWRRD